MKVRDALLITALFLGAAIFAAMLLRGVHGGGPVEEPSSQEPGAPAPALPAPQEPASPSRPATRSSLALVSAGPGGGAFGVAGRPVRAPAASAATPSIDDDDLREQREFLRLHGAEVTAYHAKLQRVGWRYRARVPVVREVDLAFGRLPRYMEVKRAYERDGDPFKFCRDAVALPEVRTEIRRWLADPRAWSASLSMTTEALKDPPSREIYTGWQQFMGTQAMVDYFIEFNSEVSTHGKLIQTAVARQDTATLQRLMRDFSPGAASGSQAPPPETTR